MEPFLQAVMVRPTNRPLAVLHSARPHPRWGRWSILAEPTCFYRFTDHSQWIGDIPEPLASLTWTHDPLTDVDQILAATRQTGTASSDAAPFQTGGWIGYFSYDLGRVIEPAAQVARGSLDDRGWPLLELGWCPNAMIYDHLTGNWEVVGEGLEGRLDHDLLRQHCSSSDAYLAPGDWTSSLSPDAYLEVVRRTIEYIRAGDVFQANITQRLTVPFQGSTRSLFSRAMTLSRAGYGGCLELSSGRTLISLSPELFLQVDPVSGAITTRPIKGTLPASARPAELEQSAKDAAELHMIVDLMRNDLGRICEYGTVRVVNPRCIESYPTIHHGVSEICGSLRPGISFGDILRATFPGGSVTGAPKIRAMQIIDELEPVRRGPYCGAIGCIDNAGGVRLNIPIRTLALTGNRPSHRWDEIEGWIDYGAGGGIVADSDPLAEYRESMDKAAVFRMSLSSPIPASDPVQAFDSFSSRPSDCERCEAAENAQN